MTVSVSPMRKKKSKQFLTLTNDLSGLAVTAEWTINVASFFSYGRTPIKCFFVCFFGTYIYVWNIEGYCELCRYKLNELHIVPKKYWCIYQLLNSYIIEDFFFSLVDCYCWFMHLSCPPPPPTIPYQKLGPLCSNRLRRGFFFINKSPRCWTNHCSLFSTS